MFDELALSSHERNKQLLTFLWPIKPMVMRVHGVQGYKFMIESKTSKYKLKSMLMINVRG